MDNAETINRLNACEYIYLKRIVDESDLVLNVVIVEARAQPELEQIDTGNTALDKAIGLSYPIRIKAGYKMFLLKFKRYLSYAVRDETYTRPESTENYALKLRTYKQSTFLDYLAKSTSTDRHDPGPFTHFAIICGDHIVDVASYDPPEVSEGIVPEGMYA